MITEVEDFFTRGCGRCSRFDTPACSARLWVEGLGLLRQICLEAGLAETVKWGHPCYMHADRNIALMGAFRDDFRLTFFNAALLQDPESILRRRGPNTQTPDMVIFSSADAVRDREDSLRAYLEEAKGYAERGIRAPKVARTLELPVELEDALTEDPEMAEAFSRLTPGRQRSYAIALNSAKKPETRLARIAKYRPGILAGKGALER
ncbi:YdeI/OmpD-associated family protein [Fluviibacterium sp. DFM31]|uniref:YdeI/OmpD-associated family protein n=1 Tax=Meridianimarinicoccus marinus TaxID=3231483 RepID=A0ABV3L6A6_9RHOB